MLVLHDTSYGFLIILWYNTNNLSFEFLLDLEVYPLGINANIHCTSYPSLISYMSYLYFNSILPRTSPAIMK